MFFLLIVYAFFVFPLFFSLYFSPFYVGSLLASIMAEFHITSGLATETQDTG
jgi:hypothetical protein